MGMVNKVVPHEELEKEALEWCKEMNSKSPTAMRMLKFGFNLIDDGLVGQQLFAGEAHDLPMEPRKPPRRGHFVEKETRIFLSFHGTSNKN